MAERQTLAERLERLRAREERLKVERNRLLARMSVLERKQDMRRKILLGSLVLAKLEREPELRALVERELAGFLTRPEDRALFAGIIELAAEKGNEEPVAQADDGASGPGLG